MLLHPARIFKFKAVDCEERMNYFMELLESRSIFFPRPYELNDPMEANSVWYYTSTAGSGYSYEAGRIPNVITNLQNEFRILSFTTNPGSPLMWAHYSNEYKGCCLVFSTKTVFSSVEPIIYSDCHFSYGNGNFTDELYNVIHESFLYKNSDWAYENEWRLIQRDEENRLELLDFEDELQGVIIGENTDIGYRDRIADFCKKNDIPCFLTYTMNGNNCIQFIPIEMNYGFYTPYDVQKFLYEKEANGLCVRNEVLLFNELNDVMAKPAYNRGKDGDL